MNAVQKISVAKGFNNLPIQIKASLASILLLLCILALGVNAYITSARSAKALHTLSDDLVSTQQAFSKIGSDVVTAHLKIFRHVSWASNGVSETLLNNLHAEIKTDLAAITRHIEALTKRTDFATKDAQALETLFEKWIALIRQAVDTIDIGQVDPAMETMMMGQTDDMFNDIVNEVRNMSNATALEADTLRRQMMIDAENTKTLILIVTTAGFVISVIVASLISKTFVQPIRSITEIMQRLSAGDINVPMAHTDRRDEIGRMVKAIEVFRKTIIEKQAVEQNLSDAIEAISEGFSLFDADDRLIVCNTHYRNIFAHGTEEVTPGMSFESIIRSVFSRGTLSVETDIEEWVKWRLQQHRNPVEPHIQHRSDGRWIRVSETLTSTGGVVAIYADITELKNREAELDQAHAQVSALNEQLRDDNKRMESELDVSRRLQLMLLPSAMELQQIKGLDVAGYMEPALEVGGDYYDVLQHDGQVRIGMGDVTGHGLESGVIMLMTQTIMRALLTSGETNPVRFLSILNKTLYENVQRMGSDKNMTLCILDYSNGVVKLSGQHEHMIVLRENGRVELVDTLDLGFPVGLVDNISEFIREKSVKLRKGDGVVLFTDGITEAENMDHQLYGLERLTEVLNAHWSKSAEQIKQAVVAHVKGFIGKQTIYDDITLLVAKQT